MMYLFLVPLIFFSFFILHSLSKDDFVLIRKNISVFQMFDLGLIAIPVSFILGRTVYIADKHAIDMIHLLRFFYFIRFPGISLVGVSIGFILAVFLVFRGKSAFKRMYDIYSISFFPILLFSLFLSYRVRHGEILLIFGSALLIGIFIFAIQSHKSFIMRDGSISLITLFLIGCFSLFQSIMSSFPKIIWSLSFSGIVSLFVMSFTALLFVMNERRALKLKNGK